MFALPDTKALSEKGAWVHIKNATTGKPAYAVGKDDKPDESRPVRIKVMGGDAPIVQVRSQRRAAKMVKDHGGAMNFSEMSEDDVFAIVADGPKSQIDDAVAATIAWENMPGSDGKDVPFTAENCRKLYEAFPAVLRDVTEVITDLPTFIKLASKS